ncbi:ABC transporter ATP-binding protein [Aquamicrobium ahrensii]|uniref:Iron(III) transport system ATP-binding protein n=1 Tax=Aquamicrobium ahrensii TaxID=469551 RepID=A0ABV2KSD3_9HYPH
MLRLDKLQKSFGGFHAVQGVSLDVAEGELVTLLGPSGCGKSTTLRCIAGLEDPTGGEIWLGNNCVYSGARRLNLPPEGRRIGMVFQSYALWPHMTVAENVAYPLLRQKISKSERETRAIQALEMVSLTNAKDSSPGRLSGGQQQRVALARALASQCQILLFDEPLSNLDVRLREQLRGEIRDLQRRLGITAIYVTHDQSEALAISDRIVVMNKGKIVQVDGPDALYTRPRTQFAARFLGSVNLLPATHIAGSTSDNLARYRTTSGVIASAPAHVKEHVSGEMQFGVRAELIRLLETADSLPPDFNVWPVTVQERVFLGEGMEYTLVTEDGQQLIAKVPPYVRLEPGTRAHAAIAAQDCFVITD